MCVCVCVCVCVVLSSNLKIRSYFIPTHLLSDLHVNVSDKTTNEWSNWGIYSKLDNTIFICPRKYLHLKIPLNT